jgi:hypothetical protein
MGNKIVITMSEIVVEEKGRFLLKGIKLLNTEDLMYSKVTVVNSNVLYT